MPVSIKSIPLVQPVVKTKTLLRRDGASKVAEVGCLVCFWVLYPTEGLSLSPWLR